MAEILLAHKIARKALLKCETEIGIVAGGHHFVDVWGRDGFFAAFGALCEGLIAPTKKTIETFLRFQRPDGLIPYRVLRSPTSLAKYRGKPTFYKTPKPNFRSHQSGGLVLDGGILAVMVARRYFEKTNDRQSLKKWYPKLLKAMNWYGKRARNGLLDEWFQGEWMDSTLKIGKTLHTNILYWAALEDMAKISGILDRKSHAKLFQGKQKHTGEVLRKTFWSGKYFSDWVDWKRQDYFGSHANMLAIVLGLATPKEAKSILKFAKKSCWNGWTLETNYPKYPFWRVSPFNYLVGIGDYQNRGGLWLQPGILYALALQKTGYKKEAKEVLKKISDKIVEHEDVFEVYEKNGSPVNRWAYKSEESFAWSAGLYLYAFSLIQL